MTENAKQEETKQLVAQFQTMQQQLQSILIQKESLKLQSLDIDRALKELSATKQANAYKITGPIMVSKPVSELRKELEESKEALDVRMEGLERAENRANERFKELQERLKKVIK